MGVLILLIIEIVMSILSNRCASLQVDPIIFNIRKINSKFSHRCLFHPSQVVFVFPALLPFFFKDSDLLIKYPFIDGKSLHYFPSMLLSYDLRKILTELQVHHSSFSYSFLMDLTQAFSVDHISSFCFTYLAM